MADEFKTYSYNGSAAYAVRGTAVPKPRPAALPEEKQAPKPRHIPAAKPSVAPLAVIGLTIVAILLMLVVHSYVVLFETTARAGELEQELSTAQANTAKLRSTYESRIDLAQIEARARELGMSQPSSRQTVYLNIAGADHAEVLHVDDRSFSEKAVDAISGGFSGVLEYFH
ncbi:MAG: hypothetical protein IJK24_04890 [Oscillospiraceae bacterium]|jgi:Septum formation initiator.|nr:hypothetical protein [Oscillospiraceae bacterium]MBQ6160263.1 hypothetical protein [Oscillospiraceae bacterium]